MNVLVTGGAGFIGSHLVERLLALGHRVVVLDDFNDFYDPALKRANVAQARTHPSFRLVEGDLLDLRLLERLFDEEPFDAVAHLAAYAGVRPSLLNPLLYERVNVAGTLGLLERCRRAAIRPRIVFASSSSVYGGRLDAPFREADDVSRPISPYAATKAAAELMCHASAHAHDLPIWCLRFFTVYGPRQRPEMAIPLFCRALKAGRPLRLFGGGAMARDFTYVDDIVEGIVAALVRAQGFEIINLGGEHAVTLAELVQRLERVLGVTATVEMAPAEVGDVPLTCADITKAARLLDWHPTIDLDTGLARFASWLNGR